MSSSGVTYPGGGGGSGAPLEGSSSHLKGPGSLILGSAFNFADSIPSALATLYPKPSGLKYLILGQEVLVVLRCLMACSLVWYSHIQHGQLVPGRKA